MAGEGQSAGLLHRLTHRVPGVPKHTDEPAGHHGRALQHRSPHPRAPHPRNRAHQIDGLNHSVERPPRVLVGWQRRIAAMFGRQLP